MTSRRERDETLFVSKRSVLGNYVWGGLMVFSGLYGLVGALLQLFLPGRSLPLLGVLGFVVLTIGVIDYGVRVLTERIEVRRECVRVRASFGLRDEEVRWTDIHRISLLDTPIVGVTTNLLLHHKDGNLHVPGSHVRRLHLTCQMILDAVLASDPSIEVDRAVTDRYGSPPFGLAPRSPPLTIGSGGGG